MYAIFSNASSLGATGEAMNHYAVQKTQMTQKLKGNVKNKRVKVIPLLDRIGCKTFHTEENA